MEAITRKEKIMSGENLTPITRKELFLAKAAGQDVQTPTPITREEHFLSKITDGGSGGGSGGNFKKKFVTLASHANASGSVNSVGITLYEMREMMGKHCWQDAGVLPTKMTAGVKEADITVPMFYAYYIEDEDNIFIYVDVTGSGNPDWVPISAASEDMDFCGTITEISRETIIEGGYYALVYYTEAEGE